MGADPDTGLTMVVKDGRFGPYVTDGTTNASLRRGDDVESLTPERASELLAERRAAGPSTRKKSGGEEGSGQEGASAKEGNGQKKTRGQEGGGQEGLRPRRQRGEEEAPATAAGRDGTHPSRRVVADGAASSPSRASTVAASPPRPSLLADDSGRS
jgi:DNA topoisomerase-1